MNAKLLFAATLAVSALSLASTVAMAAGSADGSQAGQAGGERLGQLYAEPAYRATPVTTSRSAVISALAADRVDHPYGEIGERDEVTTRRDAPSFLARAEVKADVRHAIADGRLPRNGENDESVTTASALRAAHQHIALASR